MKTRRKAKAEAVEHEHEASSQATEENAPNSISNLEIPADIDLESLQSILPHISLTSPSPESIVALYRLLLAQVDEADAIQRELEEARAEGERKDVELDQALQDRESHTNDLEKSLDALQSELKEVKQERDQLGMLAHAVRSLHSHSLSSTASSRAALQAQVTAISASQSSSSTELDTLKHRVEDTEREKRDLVGVVSRLKEDGAQREGEFKYYATIWHIFIILNRRGNSNAAI